MQGAWSGYVEEHLIPRLNGFELLMASYAMAHLKLDMLLTDTGYKPKSTQSQRFHIYLTNSLEEHHPDTGTLFANWLSNEANEANQIKKDTPVMVVMGNPPYSVSSSNKGEWIQDLIKEYKKNLNERNIQPLSDDYIKFTRYGQHFIDRTGEGVLAYISNNSFIDGIIHRQMRKSLLESFDKIYVLDLHGNSKKKETCPDGSKDENVFDIMQGVSINIFVKTGAKKKGELAEVYHYDLFGKRNYKYDFLNQNDLKNISWNKLEYSKPNYFFTQNSFSNSNNDFSLNTLFKNISSNYQTEKDSIAVQYSEKSINDIIDCFKDNEFVDVIEQLSIKDTRAMRNAYADLNENNPITIKYLYKLFDYRYSLFTGKTNGFIGRPRTKMSKNVVNKENFSLLMMRGLVDTDTFSSIFISKILADKNLYGFQTYFFPLYLYPDDDSLDSSRVPNLDMNIVKEIEKSLGLEFVAEPHPADKSAPLSRGEYSPSDMKGWQSQTDGVVLKNFTPIDILDYIYAVLHSPSYREKYKEFLKIDFPRVPYPTIDTFWQLVELGSQLRQIHLLESPLVTDFITSYPIDGDNIVDKPNYKGGKVYINKEQYFDNVLEVAWNFYIGGYQPAQKWLKDRKGRELGFEDILH